jgi:hypothetical protein
MFGAENGSTNLWLGIFGALVFGFGMMAAFMAAPTRLRRPIVATFTFVAGLVYVAYFFWPTAQDRKPTELPLNFHESVAFWLQDAVTTVGGVANILTAFLLGLGIYSLLRIHFRRLVAMQKDWFFSLVLLLSMLAMIIVGYWNWHVVKFVPNGTQLTAFDFLFNGLLQQMDAAMFSIIAFYILSAAYRAFRVRSVEATVLLSAALIVMLSLMGAVEYMWNQGVHGMLGNGAFSDNFTLTEISKWIRDTFQNSGLRALDFGVGLGALAMGLRLWLSLERGGVSS